MGNVHPCPVEEVLRAEHMLQVFLAIDWTRHGAPHAYLGKVLLCAASQVFSPRFFLLGRGTQQLDGDFSGKLNPKGRDWARGSPQYFTSGHLAYT